MPRRGLDRAPAAGDAEHERAAAEAADVLAAVLGGYGLEGDELIHAIRALRSAVHGFAAIEAAGGFGLPADREESFRRLIDALARALDEAGLAGHRGRLGVAGKAPGRSVTPS